MPEGWMERRRSRSQRRWRGVRPLGLPTSSLREADEQVAQVSGVRRPAQQRAHDEDFLDRPERRTVRVLNTVGVPTALRHGRQYDHPDRTIAGFGLIPGDEEYALGGVGLRSENPRHLGR